MHFLRLSKTIFSLTALLYLSFPETATAQKLYFKAGAARNYGLGYRTEEQFTATIATKTATYNYNVFKLNYGKGFSFKGGLGWMFTENLGAELEISYLKGSTLENKSTTRFVDIYGITGSEIKEKYGRFILLQPAMIFRTGTGTIRPYGKFGLVAAKGTIYEKIQATLWTNKAEEEWEYTGGWNFGVHGAVGLDFIATEKLTLYTEITSASLRFAPQKGLLTKAEENGATVMDRLTTSQKEYEYKESFLITFDDQDKPVLDPNAPTPLLKENWTMSSIGIGLGFKYHF